MGACLPLQDPHNVDVDVESLVRVQIIALIDWDFMNVFSRRRTGFRRSARLFELNFFVRKTFC